MTNTVKGSLTIVGSGIQVGGQITVEAQQTIAAADVVLVAGNSELVLQWLRGVNRSAESLHDYYQPGLPRADIYAAIVDAIMRPVRAGKSVCAVFYGHPGVFVQASHDVLRVARSEGVGAVMMPGISAESCLYADLSLDPGVHGMQSYQAGDFLNRNPRFDTGSNLLLWQIAMIDNPGVFDRERIATGLERLARRLLEHYPANHPVILYEAALIAVLPPRIQQVALSDLEDTTLQEHTTLLIPAII